MADNFDKFNNMFGKNKADLDAIRQGSKEVEKSLGAWAKASREIYETQKDLNNINNELNKAKQEQIKWLSKEGKELEKLENKTTKLTKKEEERLKILLLEKAALDGQVKSIDNQVKQLEKALKLQKESVKEANKLKSIARSTGNFVKTWGWDKLKSYGVFEMDKAIRNASRSMALGNNQFASFSKNLESASQDTVMMGVNVGQLAKMQQGYSKEIGRSVRLTQGGLKAMAEMAEGTGLGEQFAIGMAAAMDDFGVGAEASAQLVEDTMNMAGQMGVNGEAAAQALQKNLKLAQKYNFKGGVKALGKMSADALRLKLDMDGIAGLADKVFRPEGAIEMAAQLSIMGGEFAKLGDPMQLMFKARNDFEGFSRDIGKATSEFVQFNKETGSFEVSGGLARDRMREISKITGISVENLQKMAVEQKKLETIGAITPVNFEEKDKEFLASVAKYSEKKKGFTINLGGQERLISSLKASELESIRNQKQTLEERAEAARTFDETISDLMMSLKQLLVPVAQGLKKNIGDPLIKLQKEWKKNGFYDRLREFAKGAVEIATSIGKFLIEGALWLGPGGTLAALLGGAVLFKAASWFASGMALRAGFNAAGGFGGGMPGMGASSPIGGPAGGIFGKVGKGQGFAKNLKAAGRSGGAIAGGVLAGVTTGAMEFMENDEMGMEFGENLGRTAAKGGGAGLGAWGGAAAGAAIGSVVPVVGTLIGGLIGGALGAMGGSAIGEGIGDAIYGDESNRTNLNSTEMGSSNYFAGDAVAVPKSPTLNFLAKDKALKLDNGGMVYGTGVGGNSALASQINNSGGDSKLTVDGSASINLNISAPNITPEQINQLIDQPKLREQLNTAIQTTAANSYAGGKQTAAI